jgi:fluoroquinolone resistance protein
LQEFLDLNLAPKETMHDVISTQNPLVPGNPEMDLKPNCDLTYRQFESAIFDRVNLESSTLVGAYFRGCRFQQCKFDYCDLEGVHFLDCEFIDCTFLHADIRSCVFVDARHIRSRFNEGLLINMTVKNGLFDHCDFENCSIHNCAFEMTELLTCSIAHTSTLHNRFQATRFENMRMADCTFLYAIFDGCHFTNVQMNVGVLGACFGLTLRDLDEIGIVYAGEMQQIPGDDALAALEAEFSKRNWAFAVAILRLSFGRVTRFEGLQALALILLRVAGTGIGIKHDEFNFLESVVQYLSTKKLLPIGFLITTLEKTEQVSHLLHAGTAGQKCVQDLHNSIYIHLQSALAEFQEAIVTLTDGIGMDSEIRLTLTYESKPRLDTIALLAIAASDIQGQSIPSARLVETRHGSWIEVLETTAKAALMLYGLLILYNGFLTQIIRTKALTTAARHKTPLPVVRSLIKSTVLTQQKHAENLAVRTALGYVSDQAKAMTRTLSPRQIAAAKVAEQTQTFEVED